MLLCESYSWGIPSQERLLNTVGFACVESDPLFTVFSLFYLQVTTYIYELDVRKTHVCHSFAHPSIQQHSTECPVDTMLYSLIRDKDKMVSKNRAGGVA
jgi:hypothetical protein